ncbi:hypothetical protein SacmaDRAFT_0606 [Saccharomonospora marina XMU15]|uniref:Exopolysaccharide biosynthesis protein n=1 Tax=Saccharomonospora marina XMU15 TaxID=882083 RepID=H5X596_9PSEU|nr:hypothetical protein [Saccharomonospora marina]EHR48907.1 hypothetical protein SacmaDRAFT_0606 [Saccharomonospora marina XMU15]
MSEDFLRLSVVGRILRGRWRLLVVLAVLGALVGAAASLVFSPGYRTSSNVLLQGPRENAELLTEAQIATSSVVLERAATALDWGVAGAELADDVTAEVVDGNVIEISGTANTPQRARELADIVAEQYVTFSAQLVSSSADASAQVMRERREALRQQVAMTNERITELHSAMTSDVTVESVQARTELEGLRTALAQAMNELNQAEAATGRANLVVMGPAVLPASPAPPTLVQLTAGGAVLFFLLGLFGHLAAARADRRLDSEPEIAAALGAPVVASVDVPDQREAAGTRRYGRLLRGLLGTKRPWAPPPPVRPRGGEQDGVYRRALARLRGGSNSPEHLLAVAADDDPRARAAAGRLVTAAAQPQGRRTAVGLVEVSATRPAVPGMAERAGRARVVVVVSAGTRTAWELVGIASACAEAGLDVAGVVVAHSAVFPGRQPKPGPPRDAGVAVGDEAMAGSS